MAGATIKDQRLPGRYEELVEMMPPRAIVDDVHLHDVLAVIDDLMAIPRPTKGQASYLETLTQLVEAYESRHYAVDTSDISGLDSLRHLLGLNAMNASDLARLLGIHPRMGSKILKGERALTVAHIKRLADHFRVRPTLFL